MPSARLVTVAVTAGAFLLGACGGTDDTSSAAPTSVADLEVAGLAPARTPFCDAVPLDAVTAALGGRVADDDAWGNGDPAPGTSADVGHELGCSWSGPDGGEDATARAWVFARPVDAAFAASVVRDSAQRKGCSSPAGAKFGTPSLTQVCALRGGTTRVRHAGLFGSTWLSCELTASGGAPAVRARASAWCAAVATAVG